MAMMFQFLSVWIHDSMYASENTKNGFVEAVPVLGPLDLGPLDLGPFLCSLNPSILFRYPCLTLPHTPTRNLQMLRTGMLVPSLDRPGCIRGKSPSPQS